MHGKKFTQFQRDFCSINYILHVRRIFVIREDYSQQNQNGI